MSTLEFNLNGLKMIEIIGQSKNDHGSYPAPLAQNFVERPPPEQEKIVIGKFVISLKNFTSFTKKALDNYHTRFKEFHPFLLHLLNLRICHGLLQEYCFWKGML